MSFLKTVNTTRGPGIAGDFASTNPRHNTLSGPTGFVAGAAGLTCGLFAWADAATYTLLSNAGQGKPNGFVHNAHNALITTYLGETSLVIPGGFMVGDLFDAGDFWAKNDGSVAAIPGYKAYAALATGKVSFAPTGTAATGGNISGNMTAATGNATATFAVNPSGAQGGPGTAPGIMDVLAIADGALYPGVTITGTGVPAGTKVVAQLDGNASSTGNYSISNPVQLSGNVSVAIAYANLTVSVVNSGAIAVGEVLSGANITVGSTVTANINANSWVVSPSQTLANITAGLLANAVETDWYAASFGQAGEVVKITHVWP